MERHKFAGKKRKPFLFDTGWQYFGVLVLLGLLGVTRVLLLHSRYVPSAVEPSRKALALHPTTGENSSEFPYGQALRAVYPYSVIPGGVESVQELRKEIAQDPVVRAHYIGFDLAKAHVVRLHRERFAYVSYRLGDRVYWTTHKLRLAKDETVITDGAHTARTRCGNQVSEALLSPTFSKEPAIETLDRATLVETAMRGGWQPSDEGQTLPTLALNFETPPIGDPAAPPIFPNPPIGLVGTGGPGGGDPNISPTGDPAAPPLFLAPPGGPGDPSRGDPPDPPMAVPEPPTLMLLLASLPLLWMLRKQISWSRR